MDTFFIILLIINISLFGVNIFNMSTTDDYEELENYHKSIFWNILGVVTCLAGLYFL